MSDERFPVMLYDAACGLCAWSVQLVLRWDRRRTLRFAPLHGRFADVVRTRHPELAAVDSMMWVEPACQSAPERVFVCSDAALRAARYLGGFWRVLVIAYALPRRVRDRAYELVARHRHRLSTGDSCLLPQAADRHRFLN